MSKQFNEYQENIIAYYNSTENAYKDSWDLDNSLSIHYGYWDEKVKRFPDSLIRMNEVMMEAAGIQLGEHVLDAGCGIGGSSIFLAKTADCRVTGISLSEKQVIQARILAEKNSVGDKTSFEVMNYGSTQFPDNSFDVVWGCESICYAEDKNRFIQEAYRILKPGGRLVVADGFVAKFENNKHKTIRQWLDGWMVNYLETPARFLEFMHDAGFRNTIHKDISGFTKQSSRRLYMFYFLASLYLIWKKISFSKPASDIQKKNIAACKYQYHGLRKGLWQYGIITGTKPS